MKKHILFVIDYYKPHQWWLETVFFNIITRLANEYKITILTSHFSKELKKYEDTKDIKIYRTGTNRFSFILKSIFVGIKILLRNPDIKIIHTSTYGWAIPWSLLGLLFRKKTILTVHEIFGKLWLLYKWKLIWRFYIFFEKIIFWLPYSHYHCVSQYTMNCLRINYWIADQKMSVIHNGVDTKFWNIKNISQSEINKFKENNTMKDQFILLYYGHSWMSKWIDYLVGSLFDLCCGFKNTTVVLNIIPASRNNIILDKIKLVQKKLGNLSNKIKIFHWMSEEKLRLLVASCDVVIAPSISEWFGSVHTESVAMWKILITTNIGPLPEVLWGKVIFMHPQSKKEIIKSVQKAINKQYQNLPEKIFLWDETVKKIIKLYNKKIPKNLGL